MARLTKRSGNWLTRFTPNTGPHNKFVGRGGSAATWLWIGVEDVESLYEEYKASGARILRPPQNYPWAFEMHVEDPDGHVLRFGSEPRADRRLAIADF